MRAILACLMLLAALPARGQEVLGLAPGHTLRLHAAARAEAPVSRAYAVSLAAGDWLAVTAPAAQVMGAATEPAIEVLGPGGAAAQDYGRVVVRAAVAGTWRVVVRDFHALSLSRYPAGHPVVDPGIAPAAVRVDGRGLGAVPAIAVEPLVPRYDDAPPPSGWPARLAVKLGEDFAIHLYRRDAMRQMELWPPDPVPVVAALLRGTAPVEARTDLPLFPIGNFAVAFAAQAERRLGPCMDWVRYLAFHTQESVWPFERLAYVALGLSRDGRVFATALGETRPIPAPGEPAEAREGTNPAYEAALRRRIATDPAALDPPLATLDAVLASLVIPCAAP
ncbi:hypothetical protein [Falsiroseomonas ponticola]|uniref:hypothetical protein n=1 Tax=Falsiroseomonas ponticola TaxID=2786951 RepID=UPI0019335AC6|nr:hypothetical protein [Roseomonas ponticola]